jgi:hypothetical protein
MNEGIIMAFLRRISPQISSLAKRVVTGCFGYCFTPTDTEAYLGQLVTLY